MKKFLFNVILLSVFCMQAMAGTDVHSLNKGWIVKEGNNMYRTDLPTTAMGVLVNNGVYPANILSGLNYKNVDKSRFDHPWIFTKHFTLPAINKGQHVFLKFDGLNYSANILFNQKRIVPRDSVQGPYRQYLFDVTEWAAADNELLVQVFPAPSGVPNIGFVDWNPAAVDASMGIFRGISYQIVDRVLMQNTTVQSRVNTETLNEAWLTIKTQLTNLDKKTVKGALVGKMDEVSIFFPVTLKGNETKEVVITPEMITKLHIQNPKLWWCNNLGAPNMSKISLEFDIETSVCDRSDINFGIREVKDYLTPEGYRGLILNGKKVLMRGAGWTDDIFLRDDADSYAKQIEYVKEMNLNTIRLENMWGTSEALFEQCDQKGIMVLDGWSCHWEWKEYYGGDFEDNNGCIHTDDQMDLVTRQLKDQVLWLRNHPCIVGWFIGSDRIPRPALETRYRNMLATIDNRPIFTAAHEGVSTVSGTTGVKMDGPYEYVGPNYWFVDTKNGGAYGFNTETSIGAQLPQKESILKMIPADKLWPVSNEYYNYHCTAGSARMNDLGALTNAINQKFGSATDFDDYVKKAELLNYDATRSMFEAFRVNVNTQHATGIIQWMLNSAWPSLYWQLYDYYGIPTSAYYSTKAGNAVQQLVYNYKDHGVYAVNEGVETKQYKATMKLYDLSSNLIEQCDTLIDIKPSEPLRVFEVKDNFKDNAFLFLTLSESNGSQVAANTYCLSEKEDVYDWPNGNWYVTPIKEAADFKALATLPQTDLTLSASAQMREVKVTLKNNSKKVSFFNRLALKGANGNLIQYAVWSDNYVTLQPGETKTLTCTISYGNTREMALTLSGWNTKEQTVKVQ